MKRGTNSKIFVALALTLAVTVAAAGAVGEREGRVRSENSSTTAPGALEASEEDNGKAVQAPVYPSFRDDFYAAVNGPELDSWEIPADQSQVSWFQKLGEANFERLDAIIREAAGVKTTEGADTPAGPKHSKGADTPAGLKHSEGADTPAGLSLSSARDRAAIAAMYLTGMDREARNRGGMGKAADGFLREIDNAATVEELLTACLQFDRSYGISSLIGFSYGPDGEDSSSKVLYMRGPETGLSRENWSASDPAGKKRVEAFETLLTKLWECWGTSGEEANKTAKQVAGMMQDLASASLEIEALYDAKQTYHVYKAAQVDQLCGLAMSGSELKAVYGVEPDEKMVVEQTGMFKKLEEYLEDGKLPLLKAYVKTCLYLDLAAVTDTEALAALSDYDRAVSGAGEAKPFPRTVSEQVQRSLGFQCGRQFCETYCSEETKADVQSLVKQIARVYRQRIEALDWMSADTKEEAKKKLDTLAVKVGWPDSWPQDRYSLELLRPEEGGLYADNYLAILGARSRYEFETRREPVDRGEWYYPPQTVNAYYSPSNNEIVILAGILQPPFYDREAKPVENLGRIGFVIGHEITHAFDTSGSQYDEKGNLRDWWAAADRKRFEELSRRVIDYYNTMEIGGRHVDGELTVTENIADLGAASCITQIARQNGYDLSELYKSYAVLWAAKIRDEALASQMSVDVHAPSKIRVNAVMSATDGFYDAFQVKKGDGMYREPEERPHIW